jgi:threonyl-tRNA synthetase
VSEEQLENEIEKVLDFEKFIYNDIFNLNYYMRLGTKPDNSMGDKELWNKAEKFLENVLKKKKMNYKIAEKEGAFYGPKIDMMVKDALGREWQLATIQVDFQIPLRFNLTYEGSDSKKHHPIIIHRAVFGSIERFFALIVETFAGKFPLWLSPLQVSIVTVTDRSLKFAKEIENKLKEMDMRVELNDKQETLGKKVRDAQIAKANYVLTIGDKELDSKTIAVRNRDGKVKFNVKTEEFLNLLKEEISTRSLISKL